MDFKKGQESTTVTEYTEEAKLWISVYLQEGLSVENAIGKIKELHPEIQLFVEKQV